MTTPPITLVLVEDHALTRAGLRTALEASGDVRVLAEAADGPAGEAAVLAQRPAVAVIDIGLPGLDGIDLTRRLKAAHPDLKVVILTMHELDDEVLAALAAGADAYCGKSSDGATVLDAVRIVAGIVKPGELALPVRRDQAETVPALGAPGMGGLVFLEDDVVDVVGG